MKNALVIATLCLGVASLAHANTNLGAGKAIQGTAPQGGYRARRKAVKFAGTMQCVPPQLVREDQGIGAFQDVPAAGGTFVVLMWTSTAKQCGLSASENADWIVDVKGAGTERVTYTVQPNTGVARTAYITGTSGDTSSFAVRQAGAPGATAPTPTTPTPMPVPSNALSNDPSLLGAQRTCGNVPATVVKPGAQLNSEAWVLSPNRQFKLIFQKDGNLVLYKAAGDFVWNTGKLAPGGSVKMQPDGNLVTYDIQSKAIWSTGTHGKPNSFLAVQDDGKVIVYSPESCTPSVAHWVAR